MASNGDAAAAGHSHDAAPSPSKNKGFGLKKWRRRPRHGSPCAAVADFPDAGDGAADADQAHKRRLPVLEAPKRGDVPDDETSSVASGGGPPAAAWPAVDLELLVPSVGFSIGAADSENSEERSTAVSAPRGSRHQHKGGGARSSRTSEMLSRARGMRAEADNSRSSVESEIKGIGTGSGGRVQNGTIMSDEKSVGYDGGREDCDLASGEVRSGYANGSAEENGEGSENGADSVAEFIVALQTAQDALEIEIQKMAEIGEDPSDDFDTSDVTEPLASSLEPGVSELHQKIKLLEEQLGEKDTRVMELEMLLGKQRHAEASQSEYLEVSADLEDLLQQQMEAEITFFVTSRATETLKLRAEDQAALNKDEKSFNEDEINEDDKSFAENNRQVRHSIWNADNRAMLLEEQIKEVQQNQQELYATAEVLRLQNRALKLFILSFIQLGMLILALWLLLQSSPQRLPSSSPSSSSQSYVVPT